MNIEEFNQQFFNVYPELRFIFTCNSCGHSGTIYAYRRESRDFPVPNQPGRVVQREVMICPVCGRTEFTTSRR